MKFFLKYEDNIDFFYLKYLINHTTSKKLYEPFHLMFLKNNAHSKEIDPYDVLI